MSLKRGFWWGKLSGLLAGGLVGASAVASAIFLDAVLNGRIQTDLDWFWQMIIYGFAGLFLGAIFGAILGTLLGVLIAWTKLDDLAPAIWTFAWAGAGLLISLVPFDLRILLSPIVWVWLGGAVGWYCGNFFLNGAVADRKETAVSTQVDGA
jgi:hypothetical protein